MGHHLGIITQGIINFHLKIGHTAASLFLPFDILKIMYRVPKVKPPKDQPPKDLAVY
jgi:hypothetical protein